MRINKKNDLLIFSRSKKAWDSHPKDYYITEKILEDAGEIFFKKRFDWIWCEAMLSKKLAKDILKNSTDKNFSVETDFILTAFEKKYDVKNKKVDWLEWEDPFWAKINETEFFRELSEDQKKFRINYVVDSLRKFL